MLLHLIIGYLVVYNAASDGSFYTLNIKEHKQMLKQSVTEYADLHIIEMPAHHDIQHAVFFLDFANNYELVKYVQLNKCQLSSLDEVNRQRRMVAPPLTFGTHGERTSQKVFDAERIQKIETVRIEHQPAIMNTSHLRQELQVACRGLPIFWTDKMSKKEFNETIGAHMADQTITLLPQDPMKRVNCDIVDPGLPWAQCRQECLAYVVKWAPAQNICRYENVCPHASYVPTECIRHVRTIRGFQYIMCCRDGNAPRCPGTFYQHCSCVT